MNTFLFTAFFTVDAAEQRYLSFLWAITRFFAVLALCDFAQQQVAGLVLVVSQFVLIEGFRSRRGVQFAFETLDQFARLFTISISGLNRDASPAALRSALGAENAVDIRLIPAGSDLAQAEQSEAEEAERLQYYEALAGASSLSAPAQTENLLGTAQEFGELAEKVRRSSRSPACPCLRCRQRPRQRRRFRRCPLPAVQLRLDRPTSCV